MSRDVPRPVRDISTGDASLDRVQQEAVQRAADQNKGPFAAGVIVDAELAPGVVQVEHKLGREPTGYILLRWQGAPPAFFDLGMDDKRIVFLMTGVATCTVKLWVFQCQD